MRCDGIDGQPLVFKYMPVYFMVMPFQKIRKGGTQAFHLDTTIPDLELSVELTQDPRSRAALPAILTDLKRLL